jgi:hypothetical protein
MQAGLEREAAVLMQSVMRSGRKKKRRPAAVELPPTPRSPEPPYDPIW